MIPRWICTDLGRMYSYSGPTFRLPMVPTEGDNSELGLVR